MVEFYKILMVTTAVIAVVFLCAWRYAVLVHELPHARIGSVARWIYKVGDSTPLLALPALLTVIEAVYVFSCYSGYDRIYGGNLNQIVNRIAEDSGSFYTTIWSITLMFVIYNSLMNAMLALHKE